MAGVNVYAPPCATLDGGVPLIVAALAGVANDNEAENASETRLARIIVAPENTFAIANLHELGRQRPGHNGVPVFHSPDCQWRGVKDTR